MNFSLQTYNKAIGVETQDLVVKFGFCTEKEPGNYTNLTDLSECRDFLGDTVYANLTNSIASIYGFNYNPKTNGTLDKDHTTLGISMPTEETRNLFIKNFNHYKQELETLLQNPFNETLYVFDNDNKMLVFKADTFWQQSTVGISLLSYILKCLCWELDTSKDFLSAVVLTTHICPHENELRPTKEAGYLIGYEKPLKVLMANIKDIVSKQVQPDGYEVKKHIHVVHNYSGFHFAIRWKRDTVAGKFLLENV